MVRCDQKQNAHKTMLIKWILKKYIVSITDILLSSHFSVSPKTIGQLNESPLQGIVTVHGQN